MLALKIITMVCLLVTIMFNAILAGGAVRNALLYITDKTNEKALNDAVSCSGLTVLLFLVFISQIVTNFLT